MMEKREEDKKLPLRSLHDFLLEIDKEWNRFRTGSLLSFAIMLLMLLLYLRGYLAQALRGGPSSERFFAFLFAVLLVYSTYTSWRQYNFYKKWEKRIGLILHLEQELLGD